MVGWAAEVVSFSANSQSGENTYLVGMAENIFRNIKYFRKGYNSNEDEEYYLGIYHLEYQQTNDLECLKRQRAVSVVSEKS